MYISGGLRSVLSQTDSDSSSEDDAAVAVPNPKAVCEQVLLDFCVDLLLVLENALCLQLEAVFRV